MTEQLGALAQGKAAGTTGTATETLLFPNFLQRVGAADLKEWLTDLLVREARQRLVN